MASPTSSEWTKFTPTRLSWLQIDANDQLVIVATNEVVPASGSFRIELDNGIVLERSADGAPDFQVHLPTPQGFSVTDYRPAAVSGWETRSGQKANTGVKSKPSGPPQAIPIKLVPQPSIRTAELLATGVFVLVVLLQVFQSDKAMKKESVSSYQRQPTEVDTTGEYVPDSREPLPVRRE